MVQFQWFFPVHLDSLKTARDLTELGVVQHSKVHCLTLVVFKYKGSGFQGLEKQILLLLMPEEVSRKIEESTHLPRGCDVPYPSITVALIFKFFLVRQNCLYFLLELTTSYHTILKTKLFY